MIFDKAAGLCMIFVEAVGLLVLSVFTREEICTDIKSDCYGGVCRFRSYF